VIEQRHVIESVRFPDHKSNDGPLECSCGEEMLASEFKDHHGGNVMPIKAGAARMQTTAWMTKPHCRKVGCGNNASRGRGGFCISHGPEARR
jgi:hypothetical protein